VFRVTVFRVLGFLGLGFRKLIANGFYSDKKFGKDRSVEFVARLPVF